MKKIAFDVVGNDKGIEEGIRAALDFTDKYLDFSFILVGPKKEINKYTKETERIQIIDAKKLKADVSGARSARSGDNSMAIAINLVKDGKADGVISAGDSGTYLTMTTLILKRMTGVKRPAFMPVFPTIVDGKKFVMMDVGANLETSSEMLVQWAKLGRAFSKTALNVSKPKVSLLNIGTEDKKGLDFTKEAHVVLKADKKINYKGFIESRELLNGLTDVVIVDGYAGNMVLKTLEGTMTSVLTLLKTKLKSKTKYKIGALISKGAYKEVKEQIDYKSVALAYIIGLNGLAVKVHGGSDKESYFGAFVRMSEFIENNVLDSLKKEFSK